MVARALIAHCTAIGDDVIAVPRSEVDISDRDAVFAAIVGAKPDAVLNCAAYTDVDSAEADRGACYKANADGVENLALASKKVNAGFVTISTDYVFDGSDNGFYTQRHTPNPRSVYAKSKLEGEVRARNAYARSILVRTGWIFGYGGGNFLSAMHGFLGDGKSIKAIRDSYGTPTFANDLAERLRELTAADLPCTFHVTNSGEGTSYLGFAEKVCEIGGFDRDLLEEISNDDLKRSAPRPVSSKLACILSGRLGFSPLRHWELALEKFLCEMNQK